MNGGVNIDTTEYFDTIVIRRPTGLLGSDIFLIDLKELQCWVNGVNIMINNDLTIFFGRTTILILVFIQLAVNLILPQTYITIQLKKVKERIHLILQLQI